MRTLDELKERISRYRGAEFIYRDYGYIVWQCSTGENYELLFIEVKEKRKGFGRRLIREMAERINPYHSVFVVRLASNREAGEFYRAIGFKETLIKGLYKGGDAVIGVIPYSKLKG